MRWQKFLPTIIALGVLAVGGIYFLAFDRPAEPPPEPQVNFPKLIEVDHKAVARITYTAKGYTASMVKQKVKEGDQDKEQWVWADVQGSQVPENPVIDQRRIDNYLQLCCPIWTNRTITENLTDPAEYGLDKPTMTLAVTLENGQSHKVTLGSKNFVNSSYYIQLEGQKALHMAPAMMYDQLPEKDRLGDWSPPKEEKAEQPQGEAGKPAEEQKEEKKDN